MARSIRQIAGNPAMHRRLPAISELYCYAILLTYTIETGTERISGRTPVNQLKMPIDSASAKIVIPAYT
ncbi:MAG: hypothetical protein IT392_00350 [Nitrospirae bacterium]|nr:hypothetical protein [Nitrospirota bacterium]